MTDDLGRFMSEIGTFCSERDWDQYHNPKDLAIGMVTESSELLDIFRFKDEAQCRALFEDKVRRSEICDELADVFYFVLRFAQMNHIDLGKALEDKMSKNRAKYPIEKVKGKNLKYDEY